MRRTTILLALVALLIAFLGLSSMQPAGKPRAARAAGAATPGELLTSQDSRAGRARVRTAPAADAAPPESLTNAAAKESPPRAPEQGAPEGNAATDGSGDRLPGGSGNGDSPAPNAEAHAPAALTPEQEEIKRKRKGQASLNWLRDHQHADGHWSAADFGAASARKEARHTHNVEFFAPGLAWGDQGQSPDNDLAMTALALLAYIGSGYDHKEGDYRDAVRRAIKWLRAQQHESGRFGPERDNAFLPSHALCTAAMAECFGLSGDSVLKGICERAIAHLLSLQTPGNGFARQPGGYGLEAEPDLATTAWSVLALKCARMGGLEFDMAQCAQGVRSFLDAITTVAHGSDGSITVSTRLRERGSDAPEGRAPGFTALNTLDAMNCCCRCMLATDTTDFELCKALALKAVASGPAWEEQSIDFIHWYFATSAAFQCLSVRPGTGKGPDKGWSDWEKAIGTTLLKNQRGYKDNELQTWPDMLDEYGSWDAVDAFSRQGGRVYATAMASLTLQIYFRYRRLSKD